MADIEPAIQFESFSDRINIFAITQILANIKSLINDLSGKQPRLQNLLAPALTTLIAKFPHKSLMSMSVK